MNGSVYYQEPVGELPSAIQYSKLSARKGFIF